jgi:preprotein translocase subunit SecE
MTWPSRTQQIGLAVLLAVLAFVALYRALVP